MYNTNCTIASTFYFLFFRSDNSIEIWDVGSTPYLQKVFSSLNFSIEDIKWYGSRLFSCGLQGYIVEYNCLNESILVSNMIILLNIKKLFFLC